MHPLPILIPSFFSPCKHFLQGWLQIRLIDIVINVAYDWFDIRLVDILIDRCYYWLNKRLIYILICPGNAFLNFLCCLLHHWCYIWLIEVFKVWLIGSFIYPPNSALYAVTNPFPKRLDNWLEKMFIRPLHLFFSQINCLFYGRLDPRLINMFI